MTPQPPRTLLPELEDLLSSRSPQLADIVRRRVTDVRPCVALKSTRASATPMRGSWLDRLRGRPGPVPVLPATASKFGGAPYSEQNTVFDSWRFLGQINFAEATRALHEQQFPIPVGMPETGVLAVDWKGPSFTCRTRWYANPRSSAPSLPKVPEAVGRYEAAIGFTGSWTMRGLEFYDAVSSDDELQNYLIELEIDGVDVADHRLFGHTDEVLNEHYGLTPAPGRSNDIRDYALVWRIDADHAAGFHWGTNWLYVVIHKDDLARGAFEHAIVTGANA